MSRFDDIRARAAELGYAQQAVIAMPMAIAAQAPDAERLWVVCSVGDAVQRRFLAGRDPALCLALEAETPPDSAGPLDDFCRAELAALLGDMPHGFLFPHPRRQAPLPLLAVLEAAGWQRASPVMSSLHARHGSFWAVRAVVALRAEHAPAIVAPSLGDDPCLGCAAPCVEACPGGAVSAREGWRLEACAAERLLPRSPCATHCLSRLACPVGEGYRYDDAVLTYHGGVSLRALRERAAGHASPVLPFGPRASRPNED